MQLPTSVLAEYFHPPAAAGAGGRCRAMNGDQLFCFMLNFTFPERRRKWDKQCLQTNSQESQRLASQSQHN